MKKLLVGVALLFAPVAARADCGGCLIGTTGLVATCCSYNGCGNCGVEQPSFSTKHTWKVTDKGVLGLTGTAFKIVFDAADFQYHLKWKDKELSASADLSTVERAGVGRASDLQDAGMALE